VNLGDILGLLFLIFFVILPALQGFLRRSQDLPRDFEPDEIPLPGQEPRQAKQSPSQAAQPKPQQTASQTVRPQSKQPQQPQPRQTPPPARPQTPPATRPSPQPRPAAQPAPGPAPASRPLVSEPNKPPPKRGKNLEELERERYIRASQAQPQQPRPVAPPVSPVTPPQEPTFSTEPRAILNGIVWAQVLSEPRGRYWRKTRKLKR